MAVYEERCIIDDQYRGNLIIIAGTTLAIVGLTFGGIRFPWVSAQVLAPLIIGVVIIGLFSPPWERGVDDGDEGGPGRVAGGGAG